MDNDGLGVLISFCTPDVVLVARKTTSEMLKEARLVALAPSDIAQRMRYVSE